MMSPSHDSCLCNNCDELCHEALYPGGVLKFLGKCADKEVVCDRKARGIRLHFSTLAFCHVAMIFFAHKQLESVVADLTHTDP